MKKKTVVWCVTALMSLLLPAGWAHAQKSDDVEKSITALEQQWLQADKAGNPDLLAPLLADKFVNTDFDGKVTDKAQRLAEEKSIKWSNIENSDIRVIVYGNTAIAVGRSKGKGTYASGKPIEINVQWTDTWVKMPNGKWQCVASHGSPIKM